MVNTRQNQQTQDIDEDMPTNDSNLKESSSVNSREEDPSADNDVDFNPRTKGNHSMRWEMRERRPRYAPPSYGTMSRLSRHSARACRIRMSTAMDFDDDDDIDDSDLPYHEEDDDDDTIFSPCPRSRKFSTDPPLRTRSLRQATSQRHNTNDENEDKVLENGIKLEVDNDQDGDGIRRSKRQRKLTYDNFNQSWILGSQSVYVKGYPHLPHEQNAEGENGSSNEEEGRNEEAQQAEENDTKTDANNDDDVYTKRKRTRRQIVRYSPPNERPMKTRLRERRSRRITVESTGSEDSHATSEEEVERRVSRRLRRPVRRDDSSDEAQTGTGRVYHLRQNKPTVERFQATSSSSKPTRRSSRLVLCSVRRRFQRQNRDSSSSDEERFQRKKAKSLAKARSRCMPLNYDPSDANQLQKTPVHSSKPPGTSVPKGPADVDPMALDTSVRFDKVGGLEDHLRCLKEMVVFPMMYREIFEKFKIQPPKGVLFHGPPGTGKTLMARALANECSQGDRKVAFFMRKGADCLSKWVGESERQLRLLFEQAYQMRPSIIFFDEIDGLAPVRSSKQDQIHASIVSTLLALLDGLDDRGEIIVIGATNRIDAIDPALRRPGRFDRELYFPLPGKREREEILSIHTKPWSAPPSTELVSHLAEKSVGYCGSDLRLLCSEAVVQALRRRYPQIYKSSQKLLLQPDAVNVEEEDFKLAQSKIIPASSRVNPSPRALLSKTVAPLLQSQLNEAISVINEVFPHAALQSRSTICSKPIYKPHFLVCGSDDGYGQTNHISPALLEFMEHIPVHTVSLATLLELSNRNPEEAMVQIIREATRNPPSILYLPSIDKWWDLLPFTAHEIFLDRINSIPPSSPVFILGTSHTDFNLLNEQVKSLFKYDRIVLRPPTKEERQEFFRPLLLEQTTKLPISPELGEEEWEELPVAPPPPPPPPSKLQMEELHNQEEHKLRELRIFLRDICSKLARNRQFFMFTKPVDVKEVPDYLNIIKRPMDLETMMTNIDLHHYNSAQEFLCDIDLIVANALEYNPERDPEDKLIRHRACSLRDTAYTLIKAEMDTDFEEECRKISKKRNEKETQENENEKNDGSQPNNLDSSVNTHPLTSYTEQNKTPNTDSALKKREPLKAKSAPPLRTSGFLSASSRIKRPKRRHWARGFLTKKPRALKKLTDAGDTDVKSSVTSSLSNSESTQDTIVDPPEKTDPAPGKHPATSPLEKETVKRPRSASSKSPPSSQTMPNPKTPPTTPNKSLQTEETPLKSPKKRRLGRQRKLEKELTDQPDKVIIDDEGLESLFTDIVERTDCCSVEALLDCYSILDRVICKYEELWDRTDLIKDLRLTVKRLESLKIITQKTEMIVVDENEDL